MGNGKIVPMLLAAVILVLRGGDCVPLLFADKQAHECCNKGKCSPSAKADPCCATSSSATTKHFVEAEKRTSVPVLADAQVLASVDLALSPPELTSQSPLFDSVVHSPPGYKRPISLPLLI